MKQCTNEYKEIIKKAGRMIKSKITYELNNEEVIIDDDNLFSVVPNFKSNILKSAMKQLDINSRIDIPLNTVLNYQFGVKVDDEYEYINYGNYVVYSSEKQEDTNSYRIVCYDKMLYAMKDYESLGVTYPITIRNYINALCTHLGLTFANASGTFVNYDKEIPNELYLDNQGNSLGYTFRDVLDELAEATASTICINDNDELEIRYINSTSTEETVEGTEITIDNCTEANLVDLKLKGNLYQKITTGKNLLNYNEAQFTLNADGTYFLDGQSVDNNNSNATTNIKAKVLFGETYTLSFDVLGRPEYTVRLDLMDIQNNYIFETLAYDITSGKNSYTFNMNFSGDITPVVTVYGPRYPQYIFLKEIMIEKGSEATEYEPYTNGASPNPNYPQAIKVVTGQQNISISNRNSSQIFTVNLGANELAEIGDYKDYIYKENGNWYIHKEIGKVVLDGSESWRRAINNNNNNNTYRFILDSLSDAKRDSTTNLYSNYFTPTIAFTTVDNSICVASTRYSYLVISRVLTNGNYIELIDDFKTWLSTHNTIVYYILATPTETQITDTTLINQLEAIELYIGRNNIIVTANSSNNLPAILNITYHGSVNNTIIEEDSLKNINVTFKEKYGPINTIVLSRSAGSDKIALSQPSNLPDDDKNAIEITDNQIMNFNNRDTFMSGILNQLYGLEYYLNDFVSTGITYIDMCDEYEVQIGENTYKCIMFNNETNINQGLSETIYTEKPEDSVTNYKNISETDRQLQQTILEVNKQDSRIKAVAKSIILTTRDDGNSAHIKIQLLNEDGDQIGSDIDADIELSGKVAFTDLSTSNPTTTIINGDNITTGSIKSNNYVADTSGTKIDLSNGVIDSKNFKVNSTGDITANSGYIGNWQIENGSLKATDSNGNTIRFTPDYLQTAGPGGNYSIPWILIAQKISQL